MRRLPRDEGPNRQDVLPRMSRTSSLLSFSCLFTLLLTACPCPPLPRVAGMVRDQYGLPLKGASISGGAEDPLSPATTDENGRFELPSANGKFTGETCPQRRLQVTHPACGDGDKTIQPADKGEQEVTLHCCPAANAIRLKGTVLDLHSRQPVSNASVSLILVGDETPLGFSLSDESAADGTFTLDYAGPAEVPRLRSCGSRMLQVFRAGCPQGGGGAITFALEGKTGDIELGEVLYPCF
jgi:hypothetical protein